ncbi:GNAT family N-acetyltransferase [Haladaptatus sp. DYSN1]|uniref:GNAT family N-acetyltransferase n=1 Tax=unclassified Haladaptatus TaxID=2622732 RepID=UPI002407676F|nr:GNAT family protein [Haladaptatus sp. DYSN1]
MPGDPFLYGDGVVLCAVDEDDLPFLNRNINNPAVRRPLTSSIPRTMTETRRYFEEVITKEEDDFHLLICTPEDHTPVGMITLFKVARREGHGELAIWVDPEFHGNGYGTAAARCIVDFAFDEQRLHRIQARVLETNPASQRIWENLGFTHEGTHRDEDYDDGQFVDMLYYGLLEDEW